MTKSELAQAIAIAKSDSDLSAEAAQADIFDGFALPGFEPVFVTVRQVAELVRWQALQFNGELDSEALQVVARAGRRRFQIIG